MWVHGASQEEVVVSLSMSCQSALAAVNKPYPSNDVMWQLLQRGARVHVASQIHPPSTSTTTTTTSFEFKESFPDPVMENDPELNAVCVALCVMQCRNGPVFLKSVEK